VDDAVAGSDVDEVGGEVVVASSAPPVVDPVDDATVGDDVVLVVDPTDVDDPPTAGREPSAGDVAAGVGGVVRELSSSSPPQALRTRVAIARTEAVRR
jgi:hypothetical protein